MSKTRSYHVQILKSASTEFWCCYDYVRPKNQTTLVVSGLVAQPVFSYLDKIHIADGAILAHSVNTLWEITFGNSVIFPVDYFYDYSKQPYLFPLVIGRDIRVNHTTAILQWSKPNNPGHSKPTTSFSLVQERKTPDTKSFFQDVQVQGSTTECSASNFTQYWDKTDSIAIRFEATCVIKCPVSETIS